MTSIHLTIAPQGTIKTFGPFGPKYKVGKPIEELPDGDWLIEVTILDSGEKTEYRATHISDDPEAH